jgi:hypothetical protein
VHLWGLLKMGGRQLLTITFCSLVCGGAIS